MPTIRIPTPLRKLTNEQEVVQAAGTNIEAIIDDSGSMASTDPNRLRVAALDLLIETPGNEKITFGALEFGGNLSSLGIGSVENEPPPADTVNVTETPAIIAPR